VPTLLAARAIPTSRRSCSGASRPAQDLQGPLDGYNQLPYLTGQQREPRAEFFYFNDDGDLVACATRTGRSSSWSSGRRDAAVWAEPFTALRFRSCSTCAPTLSSGPTSPRTHYYDWELTSSPVMAGSVLVVAKYLESYKDFPPSQRPAPSPSTRRWRS
jgi:arylsulfatase